MSWAEERRARAVVERFLASTADRLGIAKRYRCWQVRFVSDRFARRRLIECRLPVHTYDIRYHISPRVRGRVRGRPPMGEFMDRALASRLTLRLTMLARCLVFETRLIRQGMDHHRPPARAYRTDLITRRLFELWNVDREVIVSNAPRMFRSRRWTLASTAAKSWFLEDGMLLAIDTAPNLPARFPPLITSFDVDVLETHYVNLAPQVGIEPRVHVERARIVIGRTIPETVASGMADRPLSDIVRHPVFDDPRLRIVGARTGARRTVLEVVDPVVWLSEDACGEAPIPGPARLGPKGR